MSEFHGYSDQPVKIQAPQQNADMQRMQAPQQNTGMQRMQAPLQNADMQRMQVPPQVPFGDRSRQGMPPRKQKKKFSFLNLIIILLSIVLAISIVITIFSFREAGSIYYDDENGLHYRLTDGEYSALAERYYETAIGREDHPKVKRVSEYYAVGLYYEKAFFANAFEKAGMTEKAEQYREKMKSLEEEMGSFSAEKQKIGELFS